MISVFFASLLVAGALGPHGAGAADFTSAQQLFFGGKYEQCLEVTQAEVDRGIWNERWPRLLIECQLALGRYQDAVGTYEAAIKRYSRSLPLRLMANEVYRFNDQPEKANRELDEIFRRVQRSPDRVSSRENLVAIGRYFLIRGGDARQILELFYDRVRKVDPTYVDAYIASAELALQKFDYKLAAESLDKPAKLRPDDPYVFYLLARAWQESDSAKASAALEKALQLNPRHVPSRLLQVDHLVDAEQYEEAGQRLTDVLSVNPLSPEAWSYHAVIAHLQGHFAGEKKLREAALTSWKTNPHVDYLIGKKLAQKYRFKEAADYLRRALSMDAKFLPAKYELAQCLLRLGDEQPGWQLADEVHQTDGYNVVAHNLVTLHDNLKKFRTLERDNLIVRMDAREARIYGDAVLDLLQEAKLTLCDKYDIQPDKPIIVEIFPQQKDFAIRTFGLPGGDGFLGVCFGRVITANSPASRGSSPSNWKAVLWHEFCHVVTLEKTRNRMPRWLSEGISVYEERQRDTSWGEKISPRYREMMLGDELTPVSQLSGAFLRPKSPSHLQFAYYESSLVVEYLVEHYGFDVLKKMLVDLGAGMPINESLQRYAGSLEALDAEFAEFAKGRANALGNNVDWSRDDFPEDDFPEDTAGQDWSLWNQQHPNNYWGLRQQASVLLQKRDWAAARPVLEKLHNLYPEDTSSGNALSQLAEIHRELGDEEAEREALEKLSILDGDATSAYTRLMELASEKEDWKSLTRHAQQMLDVNPLLPIGHEMAARAGQQLGNHQQVVAALRALSTMQPTDPASIHLRTAQSLHQLGETEQAKREVLMALEEAPRYRAAQKLLLTLVASDENDQAQTSESP